MAADGTGYYDDEYVRTSDELQAEIRRAAFGEDIGQFSGLTADEYLAFAAWLGIDERSHVLEVACGSGGPALFMAERTGCRVTGVDSHEAGIAARRWQPAAGRWASSSSRLTASTSSSCGTQASSMSVWKT
jgi:SAM-dependent methyltransferase